MNTNEEYIRVCGVSRTVSMVQESIEILDNINFSISKGQSIAIVGESGSGKSTLLGLLAGLDTPDKGKIVIDDRDICAIDEDGRAAFRARYMGFVFQSFQLIPTFTALENVMLPLELRETEMDSKKTASHLLDHVGLSHRLNHYPNQLSGGEQQRVALARAFVNTPEILFADEPTGNLDGKTSDIIIDLMFEMNREQCTTLILVTHEQKLARRCQRILQLANGEVYEPAYEG